MSQLTEIKNYLRIDGDEDDSLIQLMRDAAADVLSGAGVPEITDSRYNLAIMMLTAHFYENRIIVAKNAQVPIPFGVQTLILQLKAEALPGSDDQ